MKRSDLAMIVGAIMFGFGFTGPKVILSALACLCFFIAVRDRRNEREHQGTRRNMSMTDRCAAGERCSAFDRRREG